MEAIYNYINAHRERFLEELFDLLRIPSISADPKHKGDVQKAASTVKDHLLKAGVNDARLYPTDGHPIVYGEHMVDPGAPTVLVYGHYDVQPPDPFIPTVLFLQEARAMIKGNCSCISRPLSAW